MRCSRASTCLSMRGAGPKAAPRSQRTASASGRKAWGGLDVRHTKWKPALGRSSAGAEWPPSPGECVAYVRCS